MRPAYGAEETGICGHEVTIVVDVANVMGSRPDGWWRDRAGAAVRLHDQIAQLAASGRAILPGDNQPPGENGPAFVLSARPGATVASPLRPEEVRVVEARGSGDDTIVAVVHELPGRRVVVTADRELRARCAAAGAEILGPGWLLGLLPESRGSRGSRG
jgi:hypothetical protein